MKIKVIRGTNQIGGCITEITTNKSRIIIDFGEELPNGNSKIKDEIKVEGLTYGEPKYDGVFITHSHADHIGLINKILPEIPVYVEKESYKIYKIDGEFWNKPIRNNVKLIKFKEKIKDIKDMTLTYFIVDHSAFNSAMILIEAEGKNILHTGDFRCNGRKGKIFEDTLKEIGQVDYLITEGTCLSREELKNETEEQLQKRLVPVFKKYNQIFVLQSSTNIDRLVTMFKTAKDTKKNFIEDFYTASIALELGKNNIIPNVNFDFKTPYVWNSNLLMNKKDFDYDKYWNKLKHRNKSEAVHSDYCMLVKKSMYSDIKMLWKKGLANNAILIYSMWEGYLEQDKKTANFVKNVKSLGIDFDIYHTSGHADIETLKLMHKLTNPREKTIVIHTNNKSKAKEIFGNYYPLEDEYPLDI